jgi:hypothetical protein
VGVDFDLHPVELADLFLGIAAIDILHDDFAPTRGLAVSSQEWTLLRRPSEMERSRATIDAYRAVNGSPAPAPSVHPAP